MEKLASILIASILILFASCNTDPCKDTTCLNDGQCIEGVCECPEGYEGDLCQSEIEPTVIQIKKIWVKFPITNNGQSWDMNSQYPDVFININTSQGNTIYYPATIENAIAPITYNINATSPLNVFPGDYSIEVLDDDGHPSVDPPDLMGGYTFRFYTEGNGFPEILRLESPSSEIEIEFTLNYIWN